MAVAVTTILVALHSGALLMILTKIILCVCVGKIISDYTFECFCIRNHKMGNSLHVVFDCTTKQLSDTSDSACASIIIVPPTECLNVSDYRLLSHRKQGIE